MRRSSCSRPLGSRSTTSKSSGSSRSPLARISTASRTARSTTCAASARSGTSSTPAESVSDSSAGGVYCTMTGERSGLRRSTTRITSTKISPPMPDEQGEAGQDPVPPRVRRGRRRASAPRTCPARSRSRRVTFSSAPRSASPAVNETADAAASVPAHSCAHAATASRPGLVGLPGRRSRTARSTRPGRCSRRRDPARRPVGRRPRRCGRRAVTAPNGCAWSVPTVSQKNSSASVSS